MNRLLPGLALVLCLVGPLRAHYDHGVGGERLRFEAYPEVAKPTGTDDAVLKFRSPPVIRVRGVSLDFESGITISVWVFRTGSVSPDPVVSQVGDAFGRGSFALFADGSEGRGFVLRWEDGSITEASGYVVPHGRWVHLMASYDGVRAAVYVDGKLASAVDQAGRSIASGDEPLLVGGAGVLETVPFSGKIDAVRLWGQGLARSEVEQEYAGRLEREPMAALTFDAEDANLQLSGSVALVPEAGRGRVAHFTWQPRIRVVPDSINPVTTELTIAAWVYNRGILRQGGPIVGRWGLSPAERSYVLYSVGGDGFGFRAFWRDGTQNNLTVVDTPVEAWFHYAATYDGREMRLYINGVPAGRTITVDKVFAASSAETWIGGVGTATGEAFSGYLDDVGIWSKALSEQELKQVLAGGAHANEEALTAWYAFQEESVSPDALRETRDIRPPTLEEAASAGLGEYLRGKADAYASDQLTVNRLFWLAVRHGHVGAAEVLVSLGADVNVRLGWGGHTALHAAVRDRQVEVIQFLVGQGADVNAQDKTSGSTPWEWASEFAYPILRSYLLDTAAESNLYAAVEHDAPERVKVLLKRPESWDLNGALRRAARLGRPDILELLIEAGADPNDAADGTTAHDLAVLNSRYASVDILRRAAGRTVSDTDYIDRIQALESAIENGDTRRIARLVDQDPDLLRSDPQADRTWLQLAADTGSPEAARLLIEKGADLEKVRNGHTALSWAATLGEITVGRVLVAGGAKLELFTAAGLGETGTVRELLDGDPSTPMSSTGSTRHGSDRTPLPVPPESVEDQISDALYVAARNGHAEAVLYLLEKGADPNFRAERGGTAVYWAVKEGHVRTLDVLLNAGGDPSIPDRYGQNAVQIAVRSGNVEMKKALGIGNQQKEGR